MNYYHFQAKRATGYLGESVILFNRGLDFKKGIVFLSIITYYGGKEHNNNSEYAEYYIKLFLFLFLFKLISIIINIGFYGTGHIDLLGNLYLLDLSDPNNGNYHSRLGNPIGYSHLKNYDYFTLKIGQYLKIPPLYKYEYLNYPNPKSRLILDVCFNAYREILNNGGGFVYQLTPLENRVLGINTITANPALDDLLVNTNNPFYLNNYLYLGCYNNYFNNIFGLNGFQCDFLNGNDSYAKSTEIIRHIAGIKGRFDTLNNDPYESEKMDKGIEMMGLLVIREFIELFYNNQQYYLIRNYKIPQVPDSPGFLRGVGYTFSYFLKNNPNNILKEHLEKYQAQQDALDQARQAALVDDQGNDDQVVDNATSLMDNPNAANDDLSLAI